MFYSMLVWLCSSVVKLNKMVFRLFYLKGSMIFILEWFSEFVYFLEILILLDLFFIRDLVVFVFVCFGIKVFR